MFGSIASLKRLKNFLPMATKTALAQSLLLPILDYADICYLDATEELLNKLERLQNVCIRFVFGLRKFDHVSEYRTKLKWLPIRLRREMHLLCMLFNILHSPAAPPYLRANFQRREAVSDRQPRSCNEFLLAFPKCHTDFLSKSFMVQSVRLWNLLPASIRTAETLFSFKKRLKDHYFKLCNY